jgi:16S rRNA (adenine1518-N6/adenine1519-N6)-dimethyltransferase
MPEIHAKKSLGQHWLNDDASLEAICDAANVQEGDHILEIGPGKGSLTNKLLHHGAHVIAVELDETLAKNLPHHISPICKDGPCKGELEVVQGDILKFDLTKISAGYKVVANIPYYLTSNLLRILCESSNPPTTIALLVQKEVAQRIVAKPGSMSVLSVSVQLYYIVELGQIVPAKLFIPSPKVDSQIVSLTQRKEPLFENLDGKTFFRVVKAGFSTRRKKIRSSLGGGLHVSKEEADQLLAKAGIDGDLRAQELSLQQWHEIYNAARNVSSLT